MADSGVHREMAAALKAEFPNLIITSTYRPGSRTAGSGNLSYHARGMAVDMQPRMEVFEWIRENYPNSRELIFSPAGNRQIHNGKPHTYTGITRAQHFDHVHWAVESLASAQTGGSGSSGSGGDATNNPLIPDQIEALGAFYAFITDPGLWLRIGVAVIGGILVVMAFLGMTRRKLDLSGVLNAG